MAYLSDVIGDKYKKWQKGFVLIKAGTGCGKTHFILTILTKYAMENNKKILFLVNRTKLKEQLAPSLSSMQEKTFEERLDSICDEYVEDDLMLAHAFDAETKNYMHHLAFGNTEESYPYLNLTLLTYQKFESLLSKGKMKKYDYIICDEFHYFINDSSFSDSTELSYRYIMNMGIHKKAIIVLMSASPWYLENFLKRKKYLSSNRIYKMPADYSYVRGIRLYLFIQYQKQIEYILDKHKESRIMFFTNNPSVYAYFYENHNDISCFIANEKSKTYEKYSPLMTVGNLVEYEPNQWTFNPDKRICITTSVIDNGVSIKDKSINYIFCDFDDISQVVQAFGRKRKLGDDDWCYFYLQNYNTLPEMEKRTEQALLARLIKKKMYPEFNEYVQQHNLFFNLSQFFMNYPMLKLVCCGAKHGLYRFTLRKPLYHQLCWIIEQDYEIRKFTYKEFVKKYIPELSDKIYIMFYDQKRIKRLLESYENDIITKEQRKVFLDTLSEYAPSFTNKTISKVNELLVQCKIPYTLESKRFNGGRGESYWKIDKTE